MAVDESSDEGAAATADGAEETDNSDVRGQQLQQAWSPARQAAAARVAGAPVGIDGRRRHGFGEDD
ncbi:hypothetical protein Scep_020432 [Stephania cephalantha]|uniref:Uncharacterized protein n=1 Tax=Stephania cephalantha TaxID=152367 RepID=A0AAP0NN64_9MAGN